MIAYHAMMFAREVHATQVRKYTSNPYFDHLAEVVGIAMSVGWREPQVRPDILMATAWLHDCIEDQGVTPFQLRAADMPEAVIEGVMMLSDLEQGARAERKAASRARLAAAPAWVQTIKLADLISNTSSIIKHDPKFAAVYLEEKRLLLDVLTTGDRRLHRLASSLCASFSIPSQETKETPWPTTTRP